MAAVLRHRPATRDAGAHLGDPVTRSVQFALELVHGLHRTKAETLVHGVHRVVVLGRPRVDAVGLAEWLEDGAIALTEGRPTRILGMRPYVTPTGDGLTWFDPDPTYEQDGWRPVTA